MEVQLEEYILQVKRIYRCKFGTWSNFFRQALLLNYGADDLVFFEAKAESFDLAKFAPFVHNNNILDISNELQDAIYHIERNGNSKIILTDLSIKLTRLLHAKQE